MKTLLTLLKAEYPEPKCELDYSTPHELLIAARLSAQCTDKRVNAITPELFREFCSVSDFAAADVTDIERLVKTCGLYKTKSASIKAMCEIIRERHGGTIPSDMDSLLELPGVGRKTANLILGELYGQPAIVADTHVIRLSNRLGLAVGKDAFKVEIALRKIVPPEESIAFCHRLVLHGRRVCKARNPACAQCVLFLKSCKGC
jgi:endonuclease-3